MLLYFLSISSEWIIFLQKSPERECILITSYDILWDDQPFSWTKQWTVNLCFVQGNGWSSHKISDVIKPIFKHSASEKENYSKKHQVQQIFKICQHKSIYLMTLVKYSDNVLPCSSVGWSSCRRKILSQTVSKFVSYILLRFSTVYWQLLTDTRNRRKRKGKKRK